MFYCIFFNNFQNVPENFPKFLVAIVQLRKNEAQDFENFWDYAKIR